MKLGELPAMVVERIEDDADGLRVYGRFDRLDGVAESGMFRLSRGEYAWAELVIEDQTSCSVYVTDERDPDVVKLRVGERYTWLAGHWQAPFVEAIADE